MLIECCILLSIGTSLGVFFLDLYWCDLQNYDWQLD